MRHSKILKISKLLKLATIAILLSFLTIIIFCVPTVVDQRATADGQASGIISSGYLNLNQTSWTLEGLTYNFFQIASNDDPDRKRNIYSILSSVMLIIVGLLLIYHSCIFCMLYYYWRLTHRLSIKFWDFMYLAISRGIIHPKILESV